MLDDPLAGVDGRPGQTIGTQTISTWRGTTMGRLVRWGYRLAGAGLLALAAAATFGAAGRLDGFNVIATPDHPFGSASAGAALAQAKELGANAVAIIPFLWQANPASPNIVRGSDMPDEMLRAAIRQARSAGLAVIVKPHVWVPQSWAGAVAPMSENDWRTWFAGYRDAIARIARIAAEERADALAIGTELEKTTHRPEWQGIITAVRTAFSGTLTYFAHNTEEAERIPFWTQLDAVGVTLYPALGPDEDRAGRLTKMRLVADAIDALAISAGKPALVGEIGLRSALGAAAKPWESPEERDSAPDPSLQADVLRDWITVLDRPAIRGVLIWRWFTDPKSGGLTDTDFTVQNKPAEDVLRCAWRRQCSAR